MEKRRQSFPLLYTRRGGATGQICLYALQQVLSELQIVGTNNKYLLIGETQGQIIFSLRDKPGHFPKMIVSEFSKVAEYASIPEDSHGVGHLFFTRNFHADQLAERNRLVYKWPKNN